MKRKLIFTLVILFAITSLTFTSDNKHTELITPTAHAESTQCPVVRQVCKDIWDKMYIVCRLEGVIQEQCEAIRSISYSMCVIQTSTELGITPCALRDEFIIE